MLPDGRSHFLEFQIKKGCGKVFTKIIIANMRYLTRRMRISDRLLKRWCMDRGTSELKLISADPPSSRCLPPSCLKIKYLSEKHIGMVLLSWEWIMSNYVRLTLNSNCGSSGSLLTMPSMSFKDQNNRCLVALAIFNVYVSELAFNETNLVVSFASYRRSDVFPYKLP